MEFEILFSCQSSFSQTDKARRDDPLNVVRDKLETPRCYHSPTSSGYLAEGQLHLKLSNTPVSEIATRSRFQSRREVGAGRAPTLAAAP